jgi:hypothetical protein
MILKFQWIYQKNNSKQMHGSHMRFTKMNNKNYFIGKNTHYGVIYIK